MGTQKIVCRPGESVVVPAGVAHTFKNSADGESEMFASTGRVYQRTRAGSSKCISRLREQG